MSQTISTISLIFLAYYFIGLTQARVEDRIVFGDITPRLIEAYDKSEHQPSLSNLLDVGSKPKLVNTRLVKFQPQFVTNVKPEIVTQIRPKIVSKVEPENETKVEPEVQSFEVKTHDEPKVLEIEPVKVEPKVPEIQPVKIEPKAPEIQPVKVKEPTKEVEPVILAELVKEKKTNSVLNESDFPSLMPSSSPIGFAPAPITRTTWAAKLNNKPGFAPQKLDLTKEEQFPSLSSTVKATKPKDSPMPRFGAPDLGLKSLTAKDLFKTHDEPKVPEIEPVKVEPKVPEIQPVKIEPKVPEIQPAKVKEPTKEVEPVKLAESVKEKKTNSVLNESDFPSLMPTSSPIGFASAPITRTTWAAKLNNKPGFAPQKLDLTKEEQFPSLSSTVKATKPKDSPSPRFGTPDLGLKSLTAKDLFNTDLAPREPTRIISAPRKVVIPTITRYSAPIVPKDIGTPQKCSATDLDYDFYVYSIYYSAGYCSAEGIKSPKCEGGFNIHGLWPTRNNVIGPAFCCNRKRLTSSDVRGNQRIDQIWWSYTSDNFMSWRHQWDKHGKCVRNNQMLDAPAKYMTWVANFFERMNIAGRFRRNEIVPSDTKSYPAALIERVLEQITGNKSIRLKCAIVDSRQVLTEIRFCLGKDMRYIDCPYNSCKGQIYLPQRIMKPTRSSSARF